MAFKVIRVVITEDRRVTRTTVEQFAKLATAQRKADSLNEKVAFDSTGPITSYVVEK